MSDGEVKKINDELSKEITTQKHDLKQTKTVEKNVLPTKEDLISERIVVKDHEIKKQIEENPDLIKKLHHVEVLEKNPLPTKEQIELEKKLNQSENV